MKLVADFGNTLQKIARFESDRKLDVTVFQHITAIQLAEYVKENGPFSAGILSSVIEVDPKLREVFSSLPLYIELDHTTPVPIHMAYQTPETLGHDRIALAVGAFSAFPGADCLVIGAGTCITYDLVTSDGTYHGGAISPGISMRLKALHTFTGKLPLVQQQPFDGLIGTTTDSSILSGVVNGVIEEINGVTGRYRTLYPGIRLILTGGDQDFLFDNVKSDIFAVPEMVLQGLNKILDYNGFSDQGR
jgi:type III pantothenate kinase